MQSYTEWGVRLEYGEVLTYDTEGEARDASRTLWAGCPVVTRRVSYTEWWEPKP